MGFSSVSFILILGALRLSAVDMAIYTDSLQNSWSDWSWSCTRDFANGSVVHSGTNSVAVTITNAWGAVSLHHGDINSSSYSNLTFWINGGPSGGQKLRIYAELSSGQKPAVAMTILAANTWQQMTFSLVTLGVAYQTNFSRFSIQDTTGAAQPTFYLDDIYLTTNSATPPTITLTSPADGASFSAPANISLAATVTTNGHTISKVQFYNGSSLLNEDTTPPYSYTWSGVARGSYSVKASVIYDSVASQDSAIAHITVTGPPPPAPGDLSPRIAVDQFGYMPEMSKIAVIANPQTGFNATNSYTPGATLQVRTWGSNTVVYSGSPVAWGSGATHTQSGDQVWWFDFSPVTLWGEYYIFDPANGTRSAHFRIAQNVYEQALQQAVRMYYYQRRGMDKVVPYADPRWTDGTNFMGPLQDTHCWLISNPVQATEKDLRGGWFDAGDYNKYVNFTASVISDLLFAYRQNPLIWPDNWGIPESGNGIPDLLDEVKWELDWLLRMQNANGSVLSKMGANSGVSPPSATTAQVFYGAQSTSSSLTAAGNFAQAVKAYQSVGMTDYANTLSNAAVAAWNWAAANTNVVFDNTGFSSANPEVSSYNLNTLKIRAAVWLYDITGQATYKNYVEANYTIIQGINSYWWNYYDSYVQDALLYYATLPGVSPTVASTIHSYKQSSMDSSGFMGAWTSGTDAYRAYMPDAQYQWGSSEVKCHGGLLYDEQATYGLNSSMASQYRAAAADYVHYMHGVNPLTMVFLSNMYGYGVESCANEFYHTWFGHGTIYDDALTSPNGPASGYVPGGPNASFAPDSSYSGPPLVPPMNQPPQKSYKDWNTSWPEDSWEVTEPGIYYQASYVYLLSRFVRPLTYQDWVTGYGLSGSSTNILADPDGDGVVNLAEYAFNLSPVAADHPGWPPFRLQYLSLGADSGTYLTVQFLRQMGATNLTYILQSSSDLTSWTAVCTVAGTNSPSGPGFVSQSGTGYQRQVLARDTVAVERATGPRFVRFRLVWN